MMVRPESGCKKDRPTRLQSEAAVETGGGLESTGDTRLAKVCNLEQTSSEQSGSISEFLVVATFWAHRSQSRIGPKFEDAFGMQRKCPAREQWTRPARHLEQNTDFKTTECPLHQMPKQAART
jgi:hypothetical protein